MNDLEKGPLDHLIEEFTSQRNELKKMIIDLEHFKNKLDILFPENLDKRVVRFFEEKVKAVTELFKVILDMRKEITKNAKDEFELRRKILQTDDPGGDIEGMFNIKELAEKVEKLNKKKEQIEVKFEQSEEKPQLQS